jgi:hypothetical protein
VCYQWIRDITLTPSVPPIIILLWQNKTIRLNTMKIDNVKTIILREYLFIVNACSRNTLPGKETRQAWKWPHLNLYNEYLYLCRRFPAKLALHTLSVATRILFTATASKGVAGAPSCWQAFSFPRLGRCLRWFLYWFTGHGLFWEIARRKHGRSQLFWICDTGGFDQTELSQESH